MTAGRHFCRSKPIWYPELREYRARSPRRSMSTCFRVAERFAAKYPDLRRVDGFGSNRPIQYWEEVYAISPQYRPDPKAWGTTHAWLQTPDGTVVDPTAQQYGRGRVWLYPLRNGLRWTEPGYDSAEVCPTCRACVPARYKGRPCCLFEPVEWLRHVLNVETPILGSGRILR